MAHTESAEVVEVSSDISLVSVEYPHVRRISSVMKVTGLAKGILTYRVRVNKLDDPTMWLRIRDAVDDEEVWLHGTPAQMEELRDAIQALLDLQ